MKSVAEKLSLRSDDYFVSVDIDDGKFLSRFVDSVKGISCVGKFNKNKFAKLEKFKVVDKIKLLDESVFNKVLAKYSENLSVKELVRVADNLALVMIQGVPNNKKVILTELLGDKAGIFEVWPLKTDRPGVCDLLFKVRKYKVNV